MNDMDIVRCTNCNVNTVRKHLDADTGHCVWCDPNRACPGKSLLPEDVSAVMDLMSRLNVNFEDLMVYQVLSNCEDNLTVSVDGAYRLIRRNTEVSESDDNYNWEKLFDNVQDELNDQGLWQDEDY